MGEENQNNSSESIESERQPSGLVGRELDAAVAERVFGLTSRKETYTRGFDYILESGYVSVPHYSTSIADAMEVVEKMQEHGYGWSIGTHRDGWFVRCFELPDEGLNWRHSSRVSKSLMHAICQTALLALEETAESNRKCGNDQATATSAASAPTDQD